MITFLIMFLKLSMKLYTSVFHHVLAVGGLQQDTDTGRPSRSTYRDLLSSSPRMQAGLFQGPYGTPLPSQLLPSNTSDDGMNQWSRGNLNI